MERRKILKRTGAAITVGMLGGCLSRSGSSGGQPNESNDKSTTTAPTTTQPKPSLQNRRLKMVTAGCADGKSSDKATVKLKESKKKVVVTGTLRTPDPCYVAKLANVNYDRDAGTLSVTVRAKKKKQKGATACAQCLGAIEYKSEFTFDSGVPKSVTVSHESQGKTKKVATAKQNSTTEEGT